ncbi:endolytic transglycosylase MltG [Guggenheimella bovis]
MKRFLLILALLFTLVGCDQIESSMHEPVDPNDKTMVDFTVETGESVKSVAGKLDEMKLIADSGVFKNYMSDNDLAKKLRPGTYKLSKSMRLEEIVATITKPKETARETVKVTFPEGFEVKDIINKLVEEGLVSDVEAFKKVLKEEPFDYEFLQGVDRESLLEGYLFPDTYEFYKDSTAKEIIEKFLKNFDKKYSEELRARAKELDLSTNDVVTLASIIEREGKSKDEFPIIAGVFYNRIKDGMPFQACSTVQYILGERKPVLSIADTKIESPYNTYLHKGLPPAPIASPSLTAIKAALYPEEHDYLFFVVKNMGDGTHYFAKTYDEHLKNIELSKKNLKEHQ